MPRGSQFGYIFTEDFSSDKEILQAIAHELGHGRLLLKHTFDKDYKLPQAGTDNLMDYTPLATHLAKWQWDLASDPGIAQGVFDKDEDGMMANTSNEDDLWIYGNLNDDPSFIAAAFTANIAINAYNAIGDAMLWVLEVFLTDDKQGELVRNILIEKNIEVSSEISDEMLGQMFEFKKDFRDVTIKFRDGFWKSAANLGIGILDIVTVLYPATNGTAYLAVKTPLILVPGQFLRSAKGLLYGIGSKEGTRIMHVIEHTQDNLSKPLHGIFKTQDVIGTIDEGWEIVQKIDKSKWNQNLKIGQSETIGDVTRALSVSGEDIVELFTINMKRPIGVSGGKLGDGSLLNKLLICVKQGTSEIKTAYPKK
jgi:hypothetical protein